MFADNENLVHFAIHGYFPGYAGDEDVLQAGRIGLWRACAGYDPAKGKFSTFAVLCVTNEIRRELKNRTKQAWPGGTMSLDEPLYIDDRTGAEVTAADILGVDEDGYLAAEYDLSFLGDRLSGRDLAIYGMILRGYTAAEAGRTFGITRARASAIVQKARRIARDELMPDGN